MLSVLTLTAPIYLAVAVGFLITKYGPFPADGARAVGSFVFNVALPALLFTVVSRRPIDEILQPTYLAAYAVGSVCSAMLGLLYARVVERKGAPVDAYVGMGMSCPNSGYVGYPVMLLILPTVAGPVLGMNMLVENVVTIPLLLLLAHRTAGGTGLTGQRLLAELRRTLRTLVRNPLLVAMALGLIASAVKLPQPEPIRRTLDLFAAASTAGALFAVGATLAGLQVRGVFRRTAVVSAGKLLVHPLLVAGALVALVAVGLPDLSPELRAALILSGGMPVVTIYPILAAEGGEDRPAAAVVLVTTMGSFFTLAALMAIFGLQM